ncbi:hypothetical protein V8G54_015658 [Vigna mungo]|uniref:Uncharacterized protein n=1 Tax=Vigna mungo TaxID=3915 RepID=A0AAQ3NLG7_VIGMU
MYTYLQCCYFSRKDYHQNLKPGMPRWIHHAQVPRVQGSFNQFSNTPLHRLWWIHNILLLFRKILRSDSLNPRNNMFHICDNFLLEVNWAHGTTCSHRGHGHPKGPSPRPRQ